MAITSEIKQHGGVPTLFVNGLPHPGLAYVTYLPERADYDNMARLGCNLYSVCLYFASRPVNAAELCGPFAKGIYEDRENPDFSIVDTEFQRLLNACPNALIFPRVNLNLPSWWEAEHPEAMNDVGVNGHAPRPCVASPVWRETVANWLVRLIEYIENSPWADHIIGYQLAGGQTEEWMSIDMNGCRGEALRKAFAKDCPNGTDTDFRVYSSLTNVQAIEFFAQTAKQALHGKKVIGAFYGYTFETPWWQQAHAAITELLVGTGVDFLCSPLSYNHLRPSGIDLACMTVLDTVKRHGRLYFAEADVRTCNTLPLCQSRPGICAPEHYSGGLWAGPKDPWVCRHQLRSVFGRMLTHGNALWWFDMWGGWYDHPDFRTEFAQFFALAEQALTDTQRGSIARLAVFIDEKACACTEEQDSTATTIASENRIPLGHSGVPYDVFEISDFDGVFAERLPDGTPRYTAAVFLIPHSTQAMTYALSKWKEGGRPMLTADHNAPLLTPHSIHTLCQDSGIHCWAAPGDVLYASAHWVVLHAATAGEKTIYLPDTAQIREVCASADSPTFSASHITLSMKQYETRLFRIN